MDAQPVQDLASAPLVRAEEEDEKDIAANHRVARDGSGMVRNQSWPKNAGLILIFMPKVIFLDDGRGNEECGIFT